ncbi:MAG TPA: ribokinase [Casimicrobiaceae bacterium]|nr:ribokinase [Casimicrobiaceae bacterium]
MVVVFGSINVDLVAHVARIPLPGETLAGTSFGTSPGGKGANQALAARRAGAKVRMFGAVGRDAFAASALANLDAEGIDLSGVAALDRPTGVALIHVDARGENAITVVAGANGGATAGQVPDDALGATATLVLQLEVPIGEIALLLRRTRGARVILNAAPASTLPDALLREVDILVVNESEAAVVGETLGLPTAPGTFARDAAARVRNAVVVTLGERGALAATGDESFAIAAPVTSVVDTTGAGDALVGALAAALDRGASLRHALAEGVAAGSLACRAFGAQDAIPGKEAIAALAATL